MIGVISISVIFCVAVTLFYSIKYADMKDKLMKDYKDKCNPSSIYHDSWFDENDNATGWSRCLVSFDEAVSDLEHLKYLGSETGYCHTLYIKSGGNSHGIDISLQKRKEAAEIQDAWKNFCDVLIKSLKEEKADFVQKFTEKLSKEKE